MAKAKTLAQILDSPGMPGMAREGRPTGDAGGRGDPELAPGLQSLSEITKAPRSSGAFAPLMNGNLTTHLPDSNLPDHDTIPAPSRSSDASIFQRVNRGAPPWHTEVELKLLAEPEQLAKLIDAPPVLTHARNRGTVRLLKSIYYDTPSCALYRAGVVLRVRQSGKRFVQTVKILAAKAADPLQRGEWETQVTGEMPDFQALTPLISMGLQDALARDPLRPVFCTEFRRHMRVLTLPGGTVETAFDSGIVKAGERTAAISEIELELKQGSPAALYQLALLLSDHAAVQPSVRSKAERGFDLAFETAPAVQPARQPLPDGDVSLDDAFAAILHSALHQLMVNQAAAEDGHDPEGIHQLRIALRRTRCALSLLRALAPSPTLDLLREDARWLATNLGPARNWDVFLWQSLGQVAQGCGTLDGFEPLRAAAEHARQNGYAMARAALADRRTGRFQLAFGEWIEQRGWRCDVSGERLLELTAPAISFAVHVLAKQHGRVLKRGRHFKRLPIEARHHLRLSVKKLRYAADFFLPLLGEQGPAKRYARRLSRLQERLGRFNDAGTTRLLMGELPVDAMPAVARQALGAVLGWQACSLLNAEAEVRSAWRNFRAATPPWTDRRSRAETAQD